MKSTYNLLSSFLFLFCVIFGLAGCTAKNQGHNKLEEKNKKPLTYTPINQHSLKFTSSNFPKESHVIWSDYKNTRLDDPFLSAQQASIYFDGEKLGVGKPGFLLLLKRLQLCKDQTVLIFIWEYEQPSPNGQALTPLWHALELELPFYDVTQEKNMIIVPPSW